MFCYFYSNTKNNTKENKYTVYKSEVFNNNIDTSERRARTTAKLNNDVLAGGYFTENAIPYNFKEDYTIIEVIKGTKVSQYTKMDKYIINLIEYENNLSYSIL